MILLFTVCLNTNLFYQVLIQEDAIDEMIDDLDELSNPDEVILGVLLVEETKTNLNSLNAIVTLHTQVS